MRTRRLLILLAAILTAVCFAAPASAHTRKHHAHRVVCRAGYRAEHVRIKRRVRVKIRKHHHVRYVWRTRHERVWRCEKIVRVGIPKTIPTPTPTPTSAPTQTPPIIYAAVDPTFTQASGNPLALTYAYDASALAGTLNLGAAGQLPAGILNFYSQETTTGPEVLFCSMNVGGSVTGGDCAITYSATGTYNVVTQYIPTGTSAVTATDTITVAPYTTTTALEATCGNGECIYGVTIFDQTNTPVNPTDLEWIVTDTTTGHVVGTLYGGGASEYFDEQPSPTITSPLSICMYAPDQAPPATACTDSINPNDSFSIYATYTPATDGEWTGSTSMPMSLFISSAP